MAWPATTLGLLRGVARDEVERGQVLAVGSIRAHRNFEAEVYALTKEEGGRHTPFFDGYTPQFFFRTADVTGATSVLGDAEMAMPGDEGATDYERLLRLMIVALCHIERRGAEEIVENLIAHDPSSMAAG